MKYLRQILLLLVPIIIRRKVFRLKIALFSNKQTFGNPSYSEDGLYSDHVSDFLKDPIFIEAYSFGVKNWKGESKGQSIRYRAYVASWVARQCVSINGVFVEFGVGAGIIAGTILKSLQLKNLRCPEFFLFDTFEGIPMHVATANEFENVIKMNKVNYDYEYFELAKEKFSAFNNVHLIRGTLPETLENFVASVSPALANGIAFVSIDLNNAFSEIESIKLIWDKISAHGIVLLDDYAFDEVFRAQKEAWDLFAKERNVEILTLPTGQGLIVKPNSIH